MSKTHGFTKAEWDGMPEEYRRVYIDIDRDEHRRIQRNRTAAKARKHARKHARKRKKKGRRNNR